MSQINKIEKKLRDLYIEIYGIDALDIILEPDSLKIRENEEELKKIKRYKRIKKDPTKSCFEIKGCSQCITKEVLEGLGIRNQDFPRWVGNIKDIEFVIIGLEVSPAVKDYLHICYSKGKKLDEAGKHLFNKLGIIFVDENLESRSYITDICKCLSTRPDKSRKVCRDKYFLREVELLQKINPDINIKLIIQGLTTADFLRKYIDVVVEKSTLRKNRKTRYFLYGKLKSNEKICIFAFPHTTPKMPSARNGWELIENEKKEEIQNFIYNLKK